MYLRFLLLPIAILYDAVMDIRNRLYDMKLKASARFAIPVISVGNLAVGGTGKTPMVEYLIRLLQSNYTIATLSRGYGRKSTGFRIATDNDTAATLGDEPLQIFRKFKATVQVTVGEDRALAIPMILSQFPETNVVIMDDAYQHRRVVPGYSVLLTEYGRPFYNDHVLPVGRLREGPEGSARADVIVVTKCPPHMDEDEMMTMENHFKKYANKPVYFSTIRYGEPVSFHDSSEKISRKVVLLSGIANAHVLETYVRKEFILEKHFEYRDHYDYTASDLKDVKAFLNRYQEPVSLLTTEKDKVKLEAPELKEVLAGLRAFYLPIETEFLRNGKDFDTLVTSFLKNFKPS